LRNLRVKAGKVGQVVLHEFYDIPQECYPSVKTAYESRLWTIDEKDGKNWDKLYKDLLLELDKEKTQKESKEKPNKEKAAAQPTIDPIGIGEYGKSYCPRKHNTQRGHQRPRRTRNGNDTSRGNQPRSPYNKTEGGKKGFKEGKIGFQKVIKQTDWRGSLMAPFLL